MKASIKKSVGGFTIIEAIVVLVVTAVFATLAYTFFGDKILKSHLPRENLVKSLDLNQVMVNIQADYKPYPVWKPNHACAVGDKIMPTPFSRSGQRYWYKCTKAGTSGSTEPDPWTMDTELGIPDNDVLWEYQSSPLLLTLETLKSKIGAEDAATKKVEYDKSTRKSGYYVIENRWIDFDPSTKTETSTNDHNILKVTIQNDSGETLTALFF